MSSQRTSLNNTGVPPFRRKIFKGAKPSTPVEQPTKFELVVNRTAKALGIKIPSSILLRAVG
jgi:ABC-type uncharacterized transport system substrate-binding protein